VEVDKDVQLSLLYYFPELSIIFKEVRIYEPDNQLQQPFSTIGKIAISFNLWDLWNGNYVIKRLTLENGKIHLRTNSDGTHNFTIIKDDTTSSSKDFAIEQIGLKNIDFSYDLLNSHQRYAFYIYDNTAQLSYNGDRYDIQSQGKWLSNGIEINGSSFLNQKNINPQAHLSYFTETQILHILPSILQIDHGKYYLNGLWDNQQNKINLDFKGDKSNLSTLTALLPPSYTSQLNTYKLTGNLYFEGKINGVIDNSNQPLIDINFGMDQATIEHSDLKSQIKNASFKGHYSNGAQHSLQSSSLSLNNIQASLNNEIIKGDFYYENFSNPYIKFDLQGTLHLSWISLFLPKGTFESCMGSLHVDIKGDGRLEALNKKSTIDQFNSEGDIDIQALDFKLKNYDNRITVKNGHLTFNKNDVAAQDINITIGKTQMSVHGLFKNLIGKIIHPERTMFIQVIVDADQIYGNELMRSDARKQESSNESFLLPQFKDYIMEIELNANSIEYNKFKAGKVNSRISWSYPYLEFRKSSMKFCGGNYQGNTTVKVLNEKLVEIKSDSKIQNMHLDSVFYVFDNFSQSFITQKHLKGQITSDISFIMQLDNKLNIPQESLVCDADIIITNGELIQFEPLNKISKFVDGTHLNHVKFSELKNHILIYNQIIQIPEMKIKSNIGEMSISGSHTFDNHINYYIGYPLKNIKKEKLDPDATFGAIRTSEHGEMKLFLIVKGTTDNFSITYDTKKVKEKIITDIKKEKDELIQLFKKKDEDKINTQQNQQQSDPEYFDFDN
jgi:hypothetical protein